VRKLARSLRAEERTGDVSEALLVLLTTSAELADLVSSDDPVNDTPIYARQKVLSAHAAMLGQLAELVGPVDSADSLLEDFLRSLTVPAAGVMDDARF
jgi:hypothetical protein